jgi:hypothetical protein
MNVMKKGTEETTIGQIRVDWNNIHERVRKYATLIEALSTVEERSVR